MTKQFSFRCKACNSKLGVPRKKRPVTSALGLNSTYTDVTVDFPKGDEEDLCLKCVGRINGINTDMNTQFSYDFGPVTLNEIEGVDYSDIDDVSRAEAVYQGWCDD